MTWAPDSWREFEARQQPDYADAARLAEVEAALAGLPPLVTIAAIDRLKAELAAAEAGHAFLLQGGDCAESFADFAESQVAATVGLLDAMAARITAQSGLPAVRVGRIAGQFAKPRSEALEWRGGGGLPAWRGDIVNDLAFEPGARRADPARMLMAYRQAAATLALLPGRIYASHEALLLPYEQALVRTDPRTGQTYSGSGHLLWIGDRTRFAGSAHVEFARGLANPIGVKCGPSLTEEELLRLLDRLNPSRERGRILLISRLGEAIDQVLPPLLRAVAGEGHPALWCCDPMHGNTVRADGGGKTRRLVSIRAEIRAFFRLTAAQGAAANGLHVEMTGQDVAECVGGPELASRYQSLCDPRLNPAQAIAVAALVGERLADARLEQAGA